jgi:hypothetical protein
MFPSNDIQAQLDLYHDRSDELIRQASDYRMIRSVREGRHRRFGRWARRSRATAEQ